MQWRIIDAIGPFFQPGADRRINWSKIPFAELERDGALCADTMRRVTEEYRRFVDQVAALGFNALTLDDLAHLIPVPEFDPGLTHRIAQYRDWYRELFEIADAAGLKVLITTDIMFYNEVLERQFDGRLSRITAFLASAFEQCFRDFPLVAGIITRIGESDGVDVKGDFHSALTVRTPRQVRRLLQALLPVCERWQRTLIFRTWSVGAYPIGDLMWNRTTCARTFDGIDSPALIVSHKYGESDFFRYLPLNKQFFRGRYRKLIELQSRREYEGFGEYPSFVGWDYESYARQLRGRADFAGFSVWCQTGGWSSFRRRTFIDADGVWNEINTIVAIDVFERGWSVEESITRLCRARWPHVSPDRLLAFLRLSDEVIKELLYIDQFSQRKLFFRRVRVPPLLWVFWDHIIINHSIRKMLRCFVIDGEAKILQGRQALVKITEMRDMAEAWGFPARDLEFQYDTFAILAASRAYFFRPFDKTIVRDLRQMTRRYRKKYASRYVILLNVEPVRLSRRRIKRYLDLLLRDQRGYRFIDLVFTIRLLSWFYPVVRRFSRNRMPSFAEQQAMGVDTLFR